MHFAVTDTEAIKMTGGARAGFFFMRDVIVYNVMIQTLSEMPLVIVKLVLFDTLLLLLRKVDTFLMQGLRLIYIFCLSKCEAESP